MNVEDIMEIYPDQGDEPFYGPSDYTPLLESIGRIVVRKDDDDYQGDTFVLLYDPETNLYGYLVFGWGSCSGCDALQGCTTYQEVLDLRNLMASQVIWRTAEEMFEWLHLHDWEGDWYGDSPTCKAFVQEAKDYLADVILGRVTPPA